MLERSYMSYSYHQKNLSEMSKDKDEPYQEDYIVHDISVSPRQNDFENIDWN